jgi:hypothetical protein
MRSWLDFRQSSLSEGEVSLGALFNEICELIAEHEPKWTREWKSELDSALDKLLAQSLDDETLEGWHLQQKAVLFLRVEMEKARLQVYVRDPVTAKVLPLLPEDWMRFSPETYIPSWGNDNFILDGNDKFAIEVSMTRRAEFIEASFRTHDPTPLSSHRSFDSRTYDGRSDASARKPEELRDCDGRNNGQLNTRHKRQGRRPEWRLQPQNRDR